MSTPTGKWLSTGLKTADAALVAVPCVLKALMVQSDGTNDASALLYDHATAASGTVVATAAASPECALGVAQASGPDGINCANGIYLDITGTGAKAVVWYRVS